MATKRDDDEEANATRTSSFFAKEVLARPWDGRTVREIETQKGVQIASTLTHPFAHQMRSQNVHELALRHGLERVAYDGVLGRDRFGRGDIREVAYDMGSALRVIGFVEALAIGGIRLDLVSSTTTRPSTRCSPRGCPGSRR